MINVYLSKNSDKQQYEHLAERLMQLKEYFVKFCGEQYRDKIEHFFEDCKFCIIDKTWALKRDYIYKTPNDADSSYLFDMQTLDFASHFSQADWQTRSETIDDSLAPSDDVNSTAEKGNETWAKIEEHEELVAIVRDNKDLIKEAVDTFYNSLFSRIKNNTSKDCPHRVYMFAFGDAIRPIFKKIADDILKNHNIKILKNYQDLYDEHAINYMMQSCASFDRYDKNPNTINELAENLCLCSTGYFYPTEAQREERMEIAKEIQMVGDFFVGQIKGNLTTSYETASDLVYYDECGNIIDNFAEHNITKAINNFYKTTRSLGLSINVEGNRPVSLITNGSNENTIVHEATHGISWKGVMGFLGTGSALNEVVTEFIARGVCRLMRKDDFTLLENGKKESSCSYSLALQYISELTTKYKDIFIKAYFTGQKFLYDEFGDTNVGKLNQILNNIIHGENYYNENIQTEFEDLFDKIEEYRQNKSENENGI